MLDHRIDPSEWGAFFDHISRHVRDIPDYGAARVFAVRPGDFPGEREEAWRDLIGVTWEPKKDTITVALDGLDHRIMEPRAVWSDEPVGGHVGHVIVVGAEERRDEIVFRRVGDMADMES